MFSDPVSQISVDGGQVQPVIKRQQNVGDDEIAYEETETGLHIGHVDAAYHTRTETKVTPEREAPIIPKETIYQENGGCRERTRHYRNDGR